jgi:hypothetical protein
MNLCKINIAPEHEMQVKVSYPLKRALSGGAPPLSNVISESQIIMTISDSSSNDSNAGNSVHVIILLLPIRF